MLIFPHPIKHTILCPRGGSPEIFVRDLVRPGHTFGLGMAPIRLVDMVEAAVARLGRGCEVAASAYWLSDVQAAIFVSLRRSGWIRRLDLRCDDGGRRWCPSAAALLDTLSPPVVWGKYHLKAFTIRQPRTGECMSVVTSQSKDPGPQTEWWLSTSDPAAHEWLAGYLCGGKTKPDTLPQDVSTALRVRSLPYHRERGQQDAREAMAGAAAVAPAEDTIGLIGGEALPSLGLVSGYAAQMARPALTLIGWWLSGKSARAIDLLEQSGLVRDVRCVVSAVQDGVYNQAASEAMREVLGPRVRYTDNHAKIALLDDGRQQRTILSTGNWQADSPRAELFWSTTDPSIWRLCSAYGEWAWSGSSRPFRGAYAPDGR